MKKELNKMSPEEQAYMLQAMQQPQVAAYGGHLYSDAGKLWTSALEIPELNYGYRFLDPKYKSPVMDLKISDVVSSIPGYVKSTHNTDINNSNENNISYAQALRTMPVIGSAIGALASVFDKPDYSNIERAEAAMNAVPKVAVQPIGQKLTYKPIDINYIANTLNNQSLGARRAMIEGSLGNSAAASPQLAALNYTS
jgi:hypothetical protein